MCVWTEPLGKGVCRCMSAEHGDNELELGPDDILVDGLLKKGIKDQSQLEVAIGDGMEFTIHGDLKGKKGKTILNNAKVSATAMTDACVCACPRGRQNAYAH